MSRGAKLHHFKVLQGTRAGIYGTRRKKSVGLDKHSTIFHIEICDTTLCTAAVGGEILW